LLVPRLFHRTLTTDEVVRHADLVIAATQVIEGRGRGVSGTC
jgi:hypothetical protein